MQAGDQAAHPQVHQSPSSRTTLESVAALRNRWPGAHFEAPDGRFHAEVVQLRLGRVTLESTIASPHSCVRDIYCIRRFPRQSLTIDVVARGILDRHDPSGHFTQNEGRLALTEVDRPFAYQSLGASESVRVILPMSYLAAHLDLTKIPRGLVERTTLSIAFASFLRSLIAASTASQAVSKALGRGLEQLSLSLILEASESYAPMHVESLAARARRAVERQIDDRNLGPKMIADEFGISVRALHAAFQDEGITVARYIRTRRLEAVAEELRRESREASISELALRYGFSSSDVMSRAFKAYFGASPSEYELEGRST